MLPDSSDTGGCFERLLSGELPPLAGHDSMSAMADLESSIEFFQRMSRRIVMDGNTSALPETCLVESRPLQTLGSVYLM